MPSRAPHWCSGCHQLTTNAGQCTACRTIGDRKRWAAVDAARPTASERGYGRAWSAISARFLRANPTCVGCGQPSTVSDHVTPRAELVAAGVSDPDATHRLQPLCDDCHRDKTRAEIVERQHRRTA